MSIVALVDGVPAAGVGIDDRGLAYGDGVFETILVADGESVWWERHLRRLQRGCEALGLAMPASELLRDEARSVIGDAVRAVLKLTLTRAAAGRGYAARLPSPVVRIVSLHPGVATGTDAMHGVSLRWCGMRLALQPRLAGIKHLNRLEQVLARSEWDDPAIAEGLVCATDGHVIGATAANLFVIRDGVMRTPSLDACGIAGTCRAWLIERAPVRIERLSPEDVVAADELFICSSLRGILPVARLDGRDRNVGPMTRHWQQQLWNEVGALRPDAEARA